MKGKRVMLLPVAACWILLFACGSRKNESDNPRGADFLPERFEDSGAVRATETRSFSGESLYQYIDGGADVYLEYGFIHLATADYALDGLQLTAEIYRFKDADHAFGLYAANRPLNPDPVAFGAEGLKTDLSVDFVKGDFYIRILAFDKSGPTPGALTALAAAIDSLLPGGDYLPEAFALFPAGDVLPFSDLMTARAFLDMRFLTDVFSRRYIVAEDTVTLFISDDPAGEKFARWFELGVYDGSVEPGPDYIPIDDGRVLLTERDKYGRIVAGWKNGKLMGMVNYGDDRSEFLVSWVGSVP